jgi:alpha-glucosidase (family GH31 glycosyl hydrolase)
MRKKLSAVSILFLIAFTTTAQETVTNDSLIINSDATTHWWTGIINDGNKMPLKDSYHTDFSSNYGNQAQPLLLSDKGDVIWSENPFKLDFRSGKLKLQGKGVTFHQIKAGNNLRDAYTYANSKLFPPSGKMPDKLLFCRPQYNTWIELVYNQNQKDIMKYAKSILSNGFPSGVLMIDDNWQEDYGKLNFHPGRFPNPKQMIDSLHSMGFKVMVWVCPFISPDCDVYRDISKRKFLVTDNKGNPAIVKWWNGSSGLLDLSNPAASEWYKSQLNRLMKEYGVDGFKFDAGDFEYYENVKSFKTDITPEEHSELYGKIGLDYPLNEYRAMWKMGGQPLAERLRDKQQGFKDLGLLVPNMLTASLMGYYFSCPDLIGGGEFTSFLNLEKLDQESVVRSAQCHALMPMMQFSVAPWRVLDNEHLDAVKQAVKIREKYTGYIVELAINAAKTGEPIIKSLEFNYPGKGYASVTDQFLLGDRLLVAPVLTKGAVTRKIVIPEGKWKSFDGKIINGPKNIEIAVKLDDLPFFEKIK